MPHDKNGKLLKEGDIVNVPCRVESITAGEEYCNVSLKTIEPMYPGDQCNTITLNAKQVEIVTTDAADAPAAEAQA